MSRCFRHKCNEEFFVVKFAYLFPYHINLSLYVRLMVMLLLLHRMEFSYSFFSPSGMVEMVMVVCVFFSVSGPLFLGKSHARIGTKANEKLFTNLSMYTETKCKCTKAPKINGPPNNVNTEDQTK